MIQYYLYLRCISYNKFLILLYVSEDALRCLGAHCRSLPVAVAVALLYAQVSLEGTPEAGQKTREEGKITGEMLQIE